jgi:peroxiredoxin (alkyl hydroperoxide reductase subunit C)
MTIALEIGDRAPDFELKGSDGEMHKLSEYRGQPVILMFYPHDFSNTCSREHAAVCELLPALVPTDAVVLGISVDSWWAHKAFAESMGITYPLLADFHPKGAVGRMYGVYDSDRGSHNRSTFVVDGDGRITRILAVGRDELPDMDELLEAAKEAAD